MKFLTVLLLSLFCSCTLYAGDNTGNIEVIITGFRNSSGKAGVNLFSQNIGFPGKHEFADKYLFTDIEQNACKLVFESVPYGSYAISVFHDENMNDKVDVTFIGMPKEGVAVSNNVKYRFAPPKFKDSVFVLDSEDKTLKIEIIYLTK